MRLSSSKLLTITFEFLVACVMPITYNGTKTNLLVEVIGVFLLGILLDKKVESCMIWTLMSTLYSEILCLLKQNFYFPRPLIMWPLMQELWTWSMQLMTHTVTRERSCLAIWVVHILTIMRKMTYPYALKRLIKE